MRCRDAEVIFRVVLKILINILMGALHSLKSVFCKYIQSHSPLCSFVYFQKYTFDRAQINTPEFLEHSFTDFHLFLKFSPHHLVDDAHVALHYLYYFGAYVLVYIVGYRNTMLTVAAEFNSGVNSLNQRFLVYACDDEITLVYRFGTLGACADANGRERMTYAGEE